MKKFFLLTLIVLLFVGCSKTVQEKGDIKTRVFLSDKKRSFYVFLSEKYSFVFTQKESVDNLNQMFKIYNHIKWLEMRAGIISMGSTSSKEKDRAALSLTFYAHPQKNGLKKLKKYGFTPSVSRKTEGYYKKDFYLKGKYTLTDKELLSKYQSYFLKNPLKFRYINYNNGKTDFAPKKTSEAIYGAGATAVVLPLSVAGWGLIGVLGVTAPIIKGVTD